LVHARSFLPVRPDVKKILLYRVSQQISDSVTVITNFGSSLKKYARKIRRLHFVLGTDGRLSQRVVESTVNRR
jgi:hypothetical protein